jgi:hypothetical protein
MKTYKVAPQKVTVRVDRVNVSVSSGPRLLIHLAWPSCSLLCPLPIHLGSEVRGTSNHVEGASHILDIILATHNEAQITPRTPQAQPGRTFEEADSVLQLHDSNLQI